MVAIIPFPVVRRRDFILKQARRVAELSAAAGERHLASQIEIQRSTMLRKGVAPGAADQECRSLECAIRTHLWQMILTPGHQA